MKAARHHALSRSAYGVVTSLVLGLLALSGQGLAKDEVPDLTDGFQPGDSSIDEMPLGPTGIMGWVYHTRRGNTSKSRQLLVVRVIEDTPADGFLKEGDVILGASGDGSEPRPFERDALHAFADAITAAEARNPAEMRLRVWRDGRTATLAIRLETMGAYSETAPYRCPKTARILKNAAEYLVESDPPLDRFGLNTLALIALNSPQIPRSSALMDKAREQIIEILPDQKNYDRMVSDQIETSSKIAWARTYQLFILAEYYLATGENPRNDVTDLVGAIDALAQTVCRGQSMFGTMGHQFSIQGEDGSVNGPYGVGYGAINSVGLTALYGLTLARDCRLPNPETRAKIDAAIDRAARFFGSFAFHGTIPYGEHPAWTKGHAVNGKSGQAALALSRVPGYRAESRYFSKMAIAAGAERVGSGHGGSFFNYLWSPMGASVGGVEATAAHFRQIRWHLELSRMANGSFYYVDLTNHWYHGTEIFRKAGMSASTPYLLVYALALRNMVVTGLGRDPAPHELSSDEVAAAVLAGTYRPEERSTEQLLDDLTHFSITVREPAAVELAKRPEVRRMEDRLYQMAVDPVFRGRHGVFKLLAELGDPDAARVLVSLFSEHDSEVRTAAIQAFGAMPRRVQFEHLDQLFDLMIERRGPIDAPHSGDPMNRELVELNALVFGKEGLLSQGLDGLEEHSSRSKFYAAIRAAATLPAGGRRGDLGHTLRQLSREDVIELSDTLLDLVYIEAPADAMFADSIRCVAAETLLRYHFTEGVVASIEMMQHGGRWSRVLMLREWAKAGKSVLQVRGETIQQLISKFEDRQFNKEKRKTLEAFERTSIDDITFTSLKRIDGIEGGEHPVRFPAKSVDLKVDYQNPTSDQNRFTWRKLDGPGQVQFSPNGSAEAAQTTVHFSGTPGRYTFEVTLSDHRGLSEVTETVGVTLAR